MQWLQDSAMSLIHSSVALWRALHTCLWSENVHLLFFHFTDMWKDNTFITQDILVLFCLGPSTGLFPSEASFLGGIRSFSWSRSEKKNTELWEPLDCFLAHLWPLQRRWSCGWERSHAELQSTRPYPRRALLEARLLWVSAPSAAGPAQTPPWGEEDVLKNADLDEPQ